MAPTNKLSPIPHPPKKPVVGNMLSLDSAAPVQDLTRLARAGRQAGFLSASTTAHIRECAPSG